MQCAMPIHAYTWLQASYHIVDQRVLDSVWPYFNTSREKRSLKNNLSDPYGPLTQSVPSTSIAAAKSFLSGIQVVPQIVSWLEFRSMPFVHHVYKGCGLD